MTVYISGKITGTTDYRERFALAEKALKADGYKVLNPVKFTAKLPEGSPWEEYMKLCVKQLMKADAIYMMKGWRKSKGATLERLIAGAVGIKIIDV